MIQLWFLKTHKNENKIFDQIRGLLCSKNLIAAKHQKVHFSILRYLQKKKLGKISCEIHFEDWSTKLDDCVREVISNKTYSNLTQPNLLEETTIMLLDNVNYWSMLRNLLEQKGYPYIQKVFRELS